MHVTPFYQRLLTIVFENIQCERHHERLNHNHTRVTVLARWAVWAQALFIQR